MIQEWISRQIVDKPSPFGTHYAYLIQKEVLSWLDMTQLPLI
ncbi:hypothetical protein [Paenibacillus polymyxa]|nr:hypothetical protein [Paenibacillus polymyxa]